MGYNNEFAFQTDLVIDIETSPLPNAANFLEPIPDAVLDDSPIEPAKNLVDPAKIAASIEQRRAARDAANAEAIAKVEQQRTEQIDRCAIDWNVGRIIAVGTWSASHGIRALVMPSEQDERDALEWVWQQARQASLVGFRIRDFDLPYLIQRSRYLGVTPLQPDLGRYSKSHQVVDVYDALTFQDSQRQYVMKRSLHAFAKRFGIEYADDVVGKDVPSLFAAGAYDLVLNHVREDVRITVELAQRLWLIAVPEVASVL